MTVADKVLNSLLYTIFRERNNSVALTPTKCREKDSSVLPTFVLFLGFLPPALDCVPVCHKNHCHPLQLPPGAKSIRCVICHAVTRIADHRSVPPPPPSAVARSPYNRAPTGPPPRSHGSKRAVICGICYRNSKHTLKGCINDAKCMKYMLVNRFKFPESSIVMLTKEETDPHKWPTKQNMRMALHWLVQGCQPGDSLVFHYSGHGSQQRNYSGDEVDGYDETLCPVDFETQGMLVDHEINMTIVRPLPRGAKLHAIIDACHSGTVLDLPFLCRMDRSGRYVWEDHHPRARVQKGSSGGEAISFSGCDDDQTSADTQIKATEALSKVTSTGAMTYSFIQAIERGHGNTYGNMLNATRSTISNTGNKRGDGIVASLYTTLLSGGSLVGGLRQEPLLTANERFDVCIRSLSPCDNTTYPPNNVSRVKSWSCFPGSSLCQIMNLQGSYITWLCVCHNFIQGPHSEHNARVESP